MLVLCRSLEHPPRIGVQLPFNVPSHPPESEKMPSQRKTVSTIRTVAAACYIGIIEVAATGQAQLRTSWRRGDAAVFQGIVVATLRYGH